MRLSLCLHREILWYCKVTNVLQDTHAFGKIAGCRAGLHAMDSLAWFTEKEGDTNRATEFLQWTEVASNLVYSWVLLFTYTILILFRLIKVIDTINHSYWSYKPTNLAIFTQL
jgi:hypothetical protein